MAIVSEGSEGSMIEGREGSMRDEGEQSVGFFNARRSTSSSRRETKIFPLTKGNQRKNKKKMIQYIHGA